MVANVGHPKLTMDVVGGRHRGETYREEGGGQIDKHAGGAQKH